MKEVIKLKRDSSDRIEFNSRVESQEIKENMIHYNLMLSAHEYRNNELMRSEYQLAAFTSPITKELTLNTKITKDSDTSRVIWILNNKDNKEEYAHIGFITEYNSKESFYLRSSNDQFSKHSIKASDPVIQKGNPDDLRVLEQTLILEPLRTDRIPHYITSKTAHFNNITNLMHYKDFSINPPQAILPKSDFQFKMKIAPMARLKETIGNEWFTLKVKGLGSFTLLDRSLRFRAEGAHQELDSHISFDRPIRSDDFFVADYTKNSEFSFNATKEGILKISFYGKSLNLEYDTSKRVDEIQLLGARYNRLDSDTEAEDITERVNSRVADVSLTFKN